MSLHLWQNLNPHLRLTDPNMYLILLYHFGDQFCTIPAEFMAIDVQHNVSKQSHAAENPVMGIWLDPEPTRDDLETQLLCMHSPESFITIFRLPSCPPRCDYCFSYCGRLTPARSKKKKKKKNASPAAAISCQFLARSLCNDVVLQARFRPNRQIMRFAASGPCIFLLSGICSVFHAR